MENNDLPKTIGDALVEATKILKQSGIENPHLDAELLMAFLLNTDRLHLILSSKKLISPEKLEGYRSIVSQRSGHYPLAYLTGEREFYGFKFHIVPGVLVPRPETEHLIEITEDTLHPRTDSLRFLEIGCGSGCISVTLAKSFSNAQVYAIDKSPVAVSLTRENAERLGVSERVHVIEMDFLKNISSLEGPFDAILSNPPYIPSAIIDTLQPEVSKFEPRLALNGGIDGLDFIRHLIQYAPSLLKPDGFLLMEIGIGQSEAVTELGLSGKFSRARVYNDLAGIPRVVKMAANTRILKVNPLKPAAEVISEAAGALRRGEPIAFPTETVYGIGARALDAEAIARIYEIKGRDEGKPISLLISDIEQVERLASEIPESAEKLMKEYFPGPLTIVLKATEKVPMAVTAGTGNVGIRMPDHPLALALIRALGTPLATTSANRSGGENTQSADEVMDQLTGRIELLLDGGRAEGGVPSTVVDLTTSPCRVLREGAIPKTEIERITGEKFD